MPRKFVNISEIRLRDENDDNRPYLSVRICDRKYKGLLDSGGQASVMDKTIADELIKKGLKLHHCNIMITTAEGRSNKALGYIFVEYRVRGLKKTIATIVVEKCPSKLILGMDFWHAYRLKPCFTSNIFALEAKDGGMGESDIVDAFGDEDIQSPRCLTAEIPHELGVNDRAKVDKVISSFPFCNPEGELNKTWLREVRIDTGDAEPIRCKMRPISPYKLAKIVEEMDRLEKRGIVERVEQSEWLHPIMAVPKPNGKLRICMDARWLNAVTRKNAYPQQNANRILGQIQAAKYVSTIDMTDAYFQVPLHKDSWAKTAFAVPTRGTYIYKRMPMGLCNSGAVLCNIIDSLFGSEFEPKAFPYLDDIIVATNTLEEHIEVLERLAKKFHYANFSISREKSKFCYRRLRYLGHIIDETGIAMDKSRIDAIVNFPRPKGIRDVQRLIGMAGWYRRFIQDFSRITAPITELLKQKHYFEWTAICEQAFLKLISALTNAPVLAMPDYSLPFEIQCDASKKGCGGVLVQVQDGVERVIAFMSQKFNVAQTKYQVTELECLAVILAIEKFRPYIEGVHFTVITDHHSLLWLKNLKDPAGRLARWALRLQAYDFTLMHRKGKFHVVPDALSRAIAVMDVALIKETKDEWYRALRESYMNAPQLNDHLKIENDLLYIRSKYDEDCQNKNCLWRICVPLEQRENIIKENHDELSSCHFGRFKTLAKIKSRYHWPKMTKEIEEYVRNCEVCKLIKPRNVVSAPPAGQFVQARMPWRIVATDICGPYVPSRRGNRFLLVAIDVFSKFTIVRPVRNATAESVTKFIEEEVILKFACPEIILSDNGVQYKSKQYAELIAEKGIHAWYTALYFAQGNPTECVNKTIGNAIRAYIRDDADHKNWDKNIQEIANAINQSCHSSTQETPSYVVFGQHMPQHATEYSNFVDSNEEAKLSPNDLLKLREIVQQRLVEAREKYAKRYNLRTREVKYSVGDIVYRENTQLSDATKDFSKKLAPRFVKCEIIAKTGTNTYELRDWGTQRTGVYHAQKFKK